MLKAAFIYTLRHFLNRYQQMILRICMFLQRLSLHGLVDFSLVLRSLLFDLVLVRDEVMISDYKDIPRIDI